MDIPWPTVPSFQTRVIYLWICVFTQHHDSTPQVILHLVYFFYPLTLWVVILVAIIRCRDWNTKRISNTIFKVTVHVWQSWALNPGILAARSTSFLPAPEILNKWSLSQQICITWEPVRNANYWALPKTDGIRNLCFTQPCSWFCCRLVSAVACTMTAPQAAWSRRRALQGKLSVPDRTGGWEGVAGRVEGKDMLGPEDRRQSSSPTSSAVYDWFWAPLWVSVFSSVKWGYWLNDLIPNFCLHSIIQLSFGIICSLCQELVEGRVWVPIFNGFFPYLEINCPRFEILGPAVLCLLPQGQKVRTNI